MKQPKISVVIPLFNKSKFIEKCLLSIENQTVFPDEVIIINDGSTDNGVDIVKRINKNKVLNIVLLDQKNKGVSSARNRGILESKNDFIAFLDADDEWGDKFIEKICSLIVLYPSAVLYTVKHRVCDNIRGCTTPRQNFGKNNTGYINDYLGLSIKYPLVNSSKIVVKKKYLNDVGCFPEGAKICEDLFVWMQLSISGSFAYDSYIGAKINIFPDNSRSSRRGEIPFPIYYYSNNLDKLNNNYKKYLWSLNIKQVLYSLMTFGRSDSIVKIKASSKIFPIKHYFLYIILLLPKKFLIFLKKL
jgi:glycosyltransferase involved in cell wall biosynthesis